MDGELLWKEVYRFVRKAARRFYVAQARRGRPDIYSMDDVALCWLWAAFRNRSLSAVMNQLKSPRERRLWQLLGFSWPRCVPHETTLRRRAQRADFSEFFGKVQRFLQKRLRPKLRYCLIDSTPLPVGRLSSDPDAGWGFHQLRGYRWHTLTSADGVILAGHITSAREHELAVAPQLVNAARASGFRAPWLIADKGYDSEPLHREVRRTWRGRLLAPLSPRGGKHSFKRTPLRRWLYEHWKTPHLRRLMRHRTAIERTYSLLKSGRFGLWSLPPWVRRISNVRLWIQLKTILYHCYLIESRN
jgi:Transposase DDE domain